MILDLSNMVWRGPNIVDSGSLTLSFNPLPQNKPIHLCLIRGRDSNNT